LKLDFIRETKNIRALTDAIATLKSRNQDLPGLGLICGQAGLGKTRAAHWFSTQYDCPYLRALATWTSRGMLQEICIELGQDPEYYTAKVFKQVKQELQLRPRLMFIDEADYLTTDWRLLETLRDLHDLTGSPFVLIGMGNIKNKLARHHQFWSRISQVVEFHPLTTEEIIFIARELAGIPLADDVAAQLTKITAGYFRDVMVALSHLERIKKANPDQPVNKKMIDMTGRAVLKRRAA
jgi:hypothetical protein